MWDYEKFFADGNIIGIKNSYTGQLFNRVIDEYENNDWIKKYKNNELASRNNKINIDFKVKHSYTTDFEIEYIIRIDEKGEISEHIFERKKDMIVEIPELKVGMFGKVLYYENGNFDDDYNNFGKFIVGIKNKIVYQNGGYDYLDEIIRSTNEKNDVLIVEIYDADFFDDCNDSTLIWRNPLYQKFLYSKGEEKND